MKKTAAAVGCSEEIQTEKNEETKDGEEEELIQTNRRMEEGGQIQRTLVVTRGVCRTVANCLISVHY